MTVEELIAFEDEVAELFGRRLVKGPVHLSSGNEAQLIEIFRGIDPSDWVFASYRNHYHALLHGVPRERVMAEILAGRSMGLHFPEHRFYTSAIVGGCLPIAVGVAAALERRGSERKVWVFVGDMAASIGAFWEAQQYAVGHDLPITLVVEDNALSCDTPTASAWGKAPLLLEGKAMVYQYERRHPHVGIGRFVEF